MKKIKAEALEITSRMKFNNAKTKTEFQKRLTELQMTKLHGKRNNRAWELSGHLGRTTNKIVNNFINWLKKN